MWFSVLTECSALKGPKKVFPRIFFERKKKTTELRKLLGIFENTFEKSKKKFFH